MAGRAAGGVIRVDSAVPGHRMVRLCETPALCHGLRAYGLGELAAAVHAIAAGAYGNTVVRLKFVHSADVVDSILAELRAPAVPA